jgi:peptide/nickel transport system permease protein
VTANASARWRRVALPQWAGMAEGRVGLVLAGLIIALALVGPLLSPQDPEAPIGIPGNPPSGSAPLGTDFLGRDVLSRLLHGGISVVGLASVATVGIYAVGITVGLIAGYSRTLIDSVLMRAVDFILSFPALLLLLLLVTGLGASPWVTVVGVVVVLFPGVSRIVRTATMEVSVRGHVEAAVARGETLEQARKGVNLDEFQKAFAGDSRVRRMIFRSYVLGPAVDAAFNDASKK